MEALKELDDKAIMKVKAYRRDYSEALTGNNAAAKTKSVSARRIKQPSVLYTSFLQKCIKFNR